MLENRNRKLSDSITLRAMYREQGTSETERQSDNGPDSDKTMSKICAPIFLIRINMYFLKIETGSFKVFREV